MSPQRLPKEKDNSGVSAMEAANMKFKIDTGYKDYTLPPQPEVEETRLNKNKLITEKLLLIPTGEPRGETSQQPLRNPQKATGERKKAAMGMLVSHFHYLFDLGRTEH